RIIHDARAWARQPNDGILLHGVSSPVTSNITEDTPPPRSATNFGHSSASHALRLKPMMPRQYTTYPFGAIGRRWHASTNLLK
ncbi:MAG: hypothetical protein ACFB3T_15370, partial [Geminicoccaceae bacterium]